MQFRLHPPSLPRIAKQPDGEGILNIMEAMIDEAEETGQECMSVCVPFIDESDEFTEGTWVPEFWLVVRKVLDE